jgi:hypothetical protein
MLDVCISVFMLHRESSGRSWGDKPLMSVVVMSHWQWTRVGGGQPRAWASERMTTLELEEGGERWTQKSVHGQWRRGRRCSGGKSPRWQLARNSNILVGRERTCGDIFLLLKHINSDSRLESLLIKKYKQRFLTRIVVDILLAYQQRF